MCVHVVQGMYEVCVCVVVVYLCVCVFVIMSSLYFKGLLVSVPARVRPSMYFTVC